MLRDRRLVVFLALVVLALWGSGPALAQDLHLTPFNNFTFNTPIGVDFHEPAGQLIMSSNYPTGLGNATTPGNLQLVQPGNAIPTQFSSLAGLTNELKLASVRNTTCTGGFIPGTVFTGNGNPGQIVRISADGAVVNNPWVTLHDTLLNFTEPALIRGSVFQDRFCAANGDLIVATGNEQGHGPENVGNIWRVTSTGVTTLVARLNKHLEGVITVPDDPTVYGPLAGRIIAGDEDRTGIETNGPDGKIFAVEPNDGTFFTIGGGNGLGPPCTPGTGLPSGCHYKTAQAFHPEDLDLIRKDAQFFGVAFRDGKVYTAPATDFVNRCGQILVTQEFPVAGTSGLYALRWNSGTSSFVADLLTSNLHVQQWEHVTFTAGEDCVPQACPVTDQPGDGTLTVNPLSSGPLAGNLLVVFNQGRSLNDNSYGTGSVGWGNKVHQFKSLVGSDHAEFIFKDGTGQVVLQFAIDYISAKTGTPSGFASLGFGGDGDSPKVGTPAHVLAFETSLDVNLNGRPAGSPFGPPFQAFCSAGNCTVTGVNLLENSPPTINPNSYTLVDPATFGRWIFDDYYAVVIDSAAFGAAGFGSVQIAEVHNSPSKKSPGDTVECPTAPGDGTTFCTDDSKAAVLAFKFEGGDCTGTVKPTECSGNAGTSAARVRISNKSKATESNADVFFDQTVAIGGGITISALAGKKSLPDDLYIHVLDAGGTVLQTIKFKTKCKEIKKEGADLGGLALTGFVAAPK